MLLWLVTLVACVFGAHAAQAGSRLPPWITPCYRDDPKFDECAMITGQKMIPRIVKGERKICMPSMDPLEIVEIQLEKSATHLGLDIALRNISIRGLNQTEIAAYHSDFQHQYFDVTLFVPTLEIISTYNVSGKILVLPITGAGPGNFTLKNVFATFIIYYNLVKNADGDNDRYMTARDFSLNFNTTRCHIKLDNLFNGDKLLGATMNQFMNENWRELVANIGPVVSGALKGLLMQIFESIAKVVPYDDVLPLSPKPPTSLWSVEALE